MNFLEASRVVREFAGGESLAFLCGLSGQVDPLVLYLRAAAAKRGREAQVRTLPFNTLGQHVIAAPVGEETEVFVLLPWDLVPECDWRSGVNATAPDEEALRQRVLDTIAQLTRRHARLLYLPAALPPLWLEPARTDAFAMWLASELRSHGAELLPADAFALGAYLASGCPLGGASLGAVAERIVDVVLRPRPESAKVLVTDLDNTVWAGIIGDDGPDGIHFLPEGKGYAHFLYQTALKRLHGDGVLLAAVSKNSAEAVLPPFRGGRMVLREEHFVAIIASWNAKSAQIRELASRLNLGLDAFVFVDDNPVELAEVALALPAVRCVRFPSAAAELPALLDALATEFARREVSAEDRQRTELYRRRLAGMLPVETSGADVDRFLHELEMVLTLHDRSTGDRTRAVQLINQTNQFNLNGLRRTDDEVADVLAGGGRLYTATLADRTGSHGEILSCLMRGDGEVVSFVLSCRVFQRRVEQAFLAWLAARTLAPTAFAFAATAKNEPTVRFLEALLGQAPADGRLPLDATHIAARGGADLAFFRVEDETRG